MLAAITKFLRKCFGISAPKIIGFGSSPGEPGPDAIWPLQRDTDGRLGIHSQPTLSPLQKRRAAKIAAGLKGVPFPDTNPKQLLADQFTELGDELRRRLGAAPGTRPLAPAPRLKASPRKKTKKWGR